MAGGVGKNYGKILQNFKILSFFCNISALKEVLLDFSKPRPYLTPLTERDWLTYHDLPQVEH